MQIKSGIGFNVALHASALVDDMTGSAGKVMCVFSGTVPTAEQFLNSVDKITGKVDYTALVAFSPDRVLLAYCYYNETLAPVFKGPDHITYPLTKASAQGFALLEGTPTWFLFGQVTDGTGLSNTPTGITEGKTGIKFGLACLGTVGSESSSADMRLVGGNIVTGVPYKFMDIDVTINSPV